MQDLGIPPEVEGDTSGVVDGVRLSEVQAVRWAATGKSTKAFSRHPWITAIVPT
jgi:hypothetical protein